MQDRLSAALKWARNNRNSTRATSARASVATVRDDAQRVVKAIAFRVEPPEVIRQYDPTEIYRTSESFRHPVFGDGRVITERDNKIEVRFGRVMKILIHASTGERVKV